MTKRVIIELIVPVSSRMEASEIAELIKLPGFRIDLEYTPVRVSAPKNLVAKLIAERQNIVLVRGEIDEDKENEIKSLPNVINVWQDTKIEPEKNNN